MRLPRPAVPALLTLLALSTPPSLRAQLAPVTVPRGYLRLDLSGSFASHDRRYRDGREEDLATDFMHDPAGRSLFPGLRTADSLLARLTDGNGSPLSLGRTTASHMVVAGTGGIGLAYGLTSRVTVFGHLPIVRVRVRSTFELDSTASGAGLNTAHPLFGDGAGAGTAAQFFSQFDAALAALADRLASGAFDGDPGLRALAEETLARGQTLRVDLFALVSAPGTATLFLPTGTSSMGAQLINAISGLQTTLGTMLGVDGFTAALPLPAQRVDSEDLRSLLGNPTGPFQGSLRTPSVAALGDVEVGAAWTMVDHFDHETGRGARFTAQGLFRLPTSWLSQQGRYFAVGTGDRQPDAEVGLTGDILLGWIGARATAGYTLQLPAEAERRIAAPDEVFPDASRLARIRRDPGEIVTLGLQPYVRIAANFGVSAGVRWQSRGTDDVTLAAGQDPIPGAAPELLALETEATWTIARAGVSYSAPLGTRDGKVSRPLDAALWWEGVVGASGGRVPKTSSIHFLLRIYRRLSTPR